MRMASLILITPTMKSVTTLMSALVMDVTRGAVRSVYVYGLRSLDNSPVTYTSTSSM